MATLADYPDDWEEKFLATPGFSVTEYVRKMSEYQNLLKNKEESDLASGLGEGAGVRSSQLWDSADPETRKSVGWGGGPFSDYEMSTGQGDPNVTRYDDWGNPVDMGNRTAGIAFNKALPNLTRVGIFGLVNKFNEKFHEIVKPGQTVATDDTTSTPLLTVSESFTDPGLEGGGLLGTISDEIEATSVGDYDPNFGFISP